MDQVGPKSEEFLKEFGINFLKSYGVSLFLKIKADVEAEEAGKGDPRRLSYRDWNQVPRTEVHEGTCYIQEGEGVGTFGGWKEYYFKEMQDYNLGAYGDKKAADNPKSKPKFVIKMAGYTLEKFVTWHYSHEASTLATELECDTPEVGYSSYSWALIHPLRTNYIMQLHKGEGGGACACLGGNKVEPADAGSENAHKAQEWMDALEGLITNSSPRDLEGNVISMAFERTVQKLSGKIDELDGFTDDGTEGEILSDMAFLAIVEAAAKPDIQAKVKESPLARIPMWMKARGTAAKTITKIMEPGWKEVQKQAEGVSKKIEPKIKEGLEPILKKKMELQDKLKEKTGGKIGEILGKKVTPHLKPIFDAFDKPMKKGLQQIIELYNKKVDELAGTDGVTELTGAVAKKLDQVPRSSYMTSDLTESAYEMAEPLSKIKELDKENFLDTLHPSEIKHAWYFKMVELLDAMIYTTEELMKEDKDLKEVKNKVLASYKFDSVYTVQQFIRETVVDMFVSKVRSLLGEFVDPIIEQVNEIIPEDLQDILDVEGELMTLINALIGEPIGKMIDSNYSLPK